MLGRAPISAVPISGAPRVYVAPPPVVVVDQPSGGYLPKRKVEASDSLLYLREGRRETKEERIAARRAFMGLPAKAIKVIKRVAERVVETQDDAKEALVEALEATNQIYREKYNAALRAEISRLKAIKALDDDDEETLLLFL